MKNAKQDESSFDGSAFSLTFSRERVFDKKERDRGRGRKRRKETVSSIFS